MVTDPAVVAAALRLGEPLYARWGANGRELVVSAAGEELGRLVASRRDRSWGWSVVGRHDGGGWHAVNAARLVAAEWLVTSGSAARGTMDWVDVMTLLSRTPVFMPPGVT